jgi:hypothetical protein
MTAPVFSISKATTVPPFGVVSSTNSAVRFRSPNGRKKTRDLILVLEMQDLVVSRISIQGVEHCAGMWSYWLKGISNQRIISNPEFPAEINWRRIWCSGAPPSSYVTIHIWRRSEFWGYKHRIEKEFPILLRCSISSALQQFGKHTPGSVPQKL